MFTIIGGDGKEYGPVSVDQLRAWITAGRANADTKAKAIGSEEWRRLGDYAEFSMSAGPPPIISAPIPEAGTPVPAPTATALMAGRGLRFGAALIDGILKSLCWLPSGLTMWRLVASNAMAGQQPSISTLMTAMNGMVLKSLPLLLALAILQGVLLSVRGQSVGKVLVGLRIVRNDDNTQAGFLKAFLVRGAIPWVIEQIPVLGGIFWSVDVCFIFGDERRCLHDLMAGTKVVPA